MFLTMKSFFNFRVCICILSAILINTSIFASVSNDGKESSGKILPSPISTSWIDGAKVNIESNSPTNFIINLKGFKSNETILMTSTSYSENMTIPIPVDGNGEISVGYMPQVKGKKTGIATIQFKRKGAETKTLKLNWGVGS